MKKFKERIWTRIIKRNQFQMDPDQQDSMGGRDPA